MTDLTRLKSALLENFSHRVTGIEVKRGNELHCRIARGDAPHLAEIMRRDFQTELSLMVATDRRADQGLFEIHYLFINARENWFLHATKELTTDNPTIASMA